MKVSKILFFIACSLFFSHSNIHAQQNKELSNTTKKEKKFSFKIGAGLYQPILNDSGITFISGTNSDGVTFSGATYDPEIKTGFSFLTSVDYALSDKFYIGLGFNGAFAKAKFIRDATVNNQTINGYLEEGAVENVHILLNFTYSPKGEGIKPFAKLGIGYVAQEVELGDVPLEFTNNEEIEIFTDYKNNGIGVIPELGIRYKKFFLSLAYSLSFNKLKGEEVDGFTSSGTVTSQGLQFNLTYNVFRF
jgi:hypothetical protein